MEMTSTVSLIWHEQQATLLFSRDDKSVNVLDEASMQALACCMDELELASPTHLLVRSDKTHCFLAGADVHAIAAVNNVEQGRLLAKRGQDLCLRLQQLPCVSIAVVQGVCLGGGLELALACDAILAVDDEKTQLGLPEIKLGIHPGFGGCVRLPKKVGWLKASEMILSGCSVHAKQAKRLGLADMVCYMEQVEQAVDVLVAKGKKQQGMKPYWFSLPPLRAIFFYVLERKVKARFPVLNMDEAYPALSATLQLFRKIAGMDDAEAYTLEAQSIGRLAVTDSCKNLIHVFFLGEGLKHQAAVRAGQTMAAGLRHTAVYGAGVMGSGIAWVVSKQGRVDLHDVSAAALSRGMTHIAGFAKRTHAHGQQRLQSIRSTLDASGLHAADVVLEAVLEDLSIKQKLWQDVESKVSETTLLLSNTSSLSVTAQQQGLQHPERLAGLHFFNPAPKMPLVEIIAGEQTSPETIQAVAAWAVSLGKYPVVVADRPGFLVNRCLMPLMTAALRLVSEGQSIVHVDGILKAYGLPMGAIELADRVGLDICLHVGEHLSASFDTDVFQLPTWFARMVKDGVLGEKSGAGFYVYEKGKAKHINEGLHAYLSYTTREKECDANIADDVVMGKQAVLDACLLPMLREAQRCLDEGVVDDAKHLDAAMIYGIGFPPFRGGLLHAMLD